MFAPNDILVYKTNSGDTTVWVAQRVVVEMCGISEFHLRTKCRDRYKQSLPPSWRQKANEPEFLLDYKSGKSWRWGFKNGRFYYDVDTIPNRAPVYYRDRLPSKDELIAVVDENHTSASRERKARAALLAQTAKEFSNMEDVHWLHVVSGMGINIATCRDYGKALGWCRFIGAVVRNGGYEAFDQPTMEAFYQACAEVIGGQKLANLKVNTGPSLRKKMHGFPTDIDEQRKWIISGKYGNVNRKKVGKYQIVDVVTGEIMPFDIHQAVMFNAYMNIGDPRKEYKETLYNETYVPMMEAFNEKPVALRTFNLHLSNFANRLLMDYHRHGEEWYKKHMLTYIPAEGLTYAHALFCGDGSGLIGYRYWKQKYNQDKKRWDKELSIMNTYAVLISDVATGYIAGYAFSREGTHEETPDMVQAAVRMAVRDGGNQTMFEFVSDNFGAFSNAKQKEYLRNVFNVVRTIEAHNSQANPAETQFRLFKNSTLRCLKSFIRSSHNVRSIEGKANVESMTKEDYPMYDEAIAQTIAAINRWNNTPRGNGKTPAEMFHGDKHPECKPIPATQMRNIFGHKTAVEITRMRGFVEVWHGDDKYMFTIPDYHDTGARRIAQATGNGYDALVYVTWDENGADIYSSDGKYILTCLPTVKAGKAHIERTPEQFYAQRELKGRKVDQIRAASDFGDDAIRTMDVLTMSNDYDVDVHFGGGKESTNEAYESEINAMIPAKRANSERKDENPPAPVSSMSEADRMMYGY